MQDQAERFWAKVEKLDGGCWEWSGQRTDRGYGRFEVGSGPRRKRHRAHRFAWELARGAIPGGLSVLHRCDNPPCCNPDHLFLGTQADNVEDMWAKGRAVVVVRKGVRIPNSTADRNRQKSACPKCGGPLTESPHLSQRTADGRGRRRCAPCKAEWQRAYMKKWKAKQLRGGGGSVGSSAGLAACG